MAQEFLEMNLDRRRRRLHAAAFIEKGDPVRLAVQCHLSHQGGMPAQNVEGGGDGDGVGVGGGQARG